MAAARPTARWPSVAIVFALATMSLTGILFTFPRAAATTYVGGPIASDTTWGPPTDTVYVLLRNVIVRPGVTLTILPGTTVRFNPNLALFVEGRLHANGFPGNEILFARNNTISLIPPLGIQFNASSVGSVTYSFIDRMARGVTAIDSSPTIMNNGIDHATIGIALSRSLANVQSNAINDTEWGIYAVNGGSPYIASNFIVNVTGPLAVGIYVTLGASADVWWNVITGVRGRNQPNAGIPGAPGADGSAAVGILVDSGGSSAVVQRNAVDILRGGRGGDGAGNPGGVGGRGGAGGGAAGIVVGNTSTADIGNNSIRNVLSGRGGNGGDSSSAAGGDGGNGGTAAGIQLLGVQSKTSAWMNWMLDITGNGAGNGGNGASDGAGGRGGDAYGALSLYSMNASAQGNTIQNLDGGPGGNSTAPGTGDNRGGAGGAASGIAITGIAGSVTLQSNTMTTIDGGVGGRGWSSGRGGNATGAVSFGDGNYNSTIMVANSVSGVTGGSGKIGFMSGGEGGTATGLVLAYTNAFVALNGVSSLRGGDGGDASGGPGATGGPGGSAFAEGYFVVPNAWSALSWMNSVAKGLPGTPLPSRVSYGTGWYVEGLASTTSVVTLENATITSIGDRDIWMNNYANGTTINTPFQTSKLMVETAGELHVKNYLSTQVFWPDGFTPVAGANVVVDEDGSTVWNIVSSTGFDQWLLTLDRSYFGSTTPTDVLNDVSVSYLAYSFASNPRTVDMAASNTQKFVMVDTDAPTSVADPLPAYFNTLTFNVNYTASDGGGVGLDTITLWYRRDAGVWTQDVTQPAGSFGSFAFTAPGDGTYAFETVATDLAGNTEAGPAAGEASTIVDTTPPGSHVDPQPPYRTSLSFLVSWAPDSGVTDITTYTIQYNRGFGWTNWLVDTTLTSSTFSAVSQGVYQFRSIAKDVAGNVEIVSGNDTWTFVDTERPVSFTNALPLYETTLMFPVTWRAESDDVASFHIDVRDNGGAWVTWINSTTLLTSNYTGLDGHTYEYRSVATDLAGNVENQPPGNESWTMVDVTLPRSLVAPLPPWRTSTTFGVAWGPEAGVTDIASYRIDVNDNGAGWTTWIASTTSTSGSFTGQDGHTYQFRSIARDRAGNTEVAPSSADASTTVDTTAPTTASTPTGTIGNNNWYTTFVMVNLSATDATSGVASILYRVDNGTWQTSLAPSVAFPVNGEGNHQIDFHATDNAGNNENPRLLRFSIDLSPPTPSITLLGTQGDNNWFTSLVAVTLSATDTASGVASVEYQLDGGSWTTYATAFSVSADGTHTVDYRATDVSGRVGTGSSASIRIDKATPLVVNTGPRGSNTNTTPRIVITFSEPMNRTSVELAFSMNPGVSGDFVWSTDSMSVMYVLDQRLESGTGYTVTLAQSAKDIAGNAIPQSTTFQFTTQGAVSGGGGFDVGGLWWIVIVVAAILGSLFFLRGRLPVGTKAVAPPPPPKEDESTIDDLFLLYHDGILIKHETRRLKPDIDTDILSGMLTAVQSFVKDSFRSEEGHLDKMTFGEMHILIGRGRWLIVAAMMGGEGTDPMARQMQRCIEEMEAEHAQVIESWDGNMTLAKTLTPYIKKLIRGDYAQTPPNV